MPHPHHSSHYISASGVNGGIPQVTQSVIHDGQDKLRYMKDNLSMGLPERPEVPDLVKTSEPGGAPNKKVILQERLPVYSESNQTKVDSTSPTYVNL